MTLPALIKREHAGSVIEQRISDGYIHATAMCKATGKLFADYTRLDATQAFLEELSTDMGIPISELIQSVRGGKTQGSWVHPYVAINLAQWLSPQFAVKVSKWVHEWLSGGRSTQVVMTKEAIQEMVGHTVANTQAIGELRAEVREIKDNVIYLTNSIKPKKEDFSDKDWEVWRQVIKVAFQGKDPVLGERRILDDNGNWLPGRVPDHWNREKAGYKNGWPTFQDINLRLREQSFRDSKAHRFRFFQDEVNRLFPNGPRNWIGKRRASHTINCPAQRSFI